MMTGVRLTSDSGRALDSRRASGGMADAPALGAIPALLYAPLSVADASDAE